MIYKKIFDKISDILENSGIPLNNIYPLLDRNIIVDVMSEIGIIPVAFPIIIEEKRKTKDDYRDIEVCFYISIVIYSDNIYETRDLLSKNMPCVSIEIEGYQFYIDEIDFKYRQDKQIRDSGAVVLDFELKIDLAMLKNMEV